MENQNEIKENAPQKRKILSVKQIKSYRNKKNELNNKINSLTIKNINTKKNKIIRPSSSFYATNINNYRYLFDNNNKETINNAKWVINLRLFDITNKNKKKLLGEPTFYQEDLDKYIKKKKSKVKKSKSAFNFETLPDLTKFKHFFKKNNDNHGTYVSKPLLDYQLSFRHNNIKLLHKWNSSTNIKNKYILSCIDLPKGKLNGKINNNFIMRPYSVKFVKEEYNGDKILKKIYYKDKVKAYNVFGTHFSLSPYNDKYIEKNYSKMNEILNSIDKNQAKTWYQNRLRNFLNKSGIDEKLKNKKKWKNW